jgi:hypothetical protein
VPTFVNTFFEERLERLFKLADLVEKIFASASLEYRVVGGLAIYQYVEEAAPDAGRLTRDIDILVRREDLEKIAQAAEPFGFRYRHAAGLDMLLPVEEPLARRAVHLVLAGERVHQEDVEATPQLGPAKVIKGMRLIPLPELVRMKLTSFRLKDQMHLKDLEEADLLPPEIEAGLPPILRERLAQVRTHK